MSTCSLCRVAKNVPPRLSLFWLQVVPVKKGIFAAPRLPAARQSWSLASVACSVSDGGSANLVPWGSDWGDGAVPTSARLPQQPQPKTFNQNRHSPHLLPAWKREPSAPAVHLGVLTERHGSARLASCGAKMICIFELVIEVWDACECAAV